MSVSASSRQRRQRKRKPVVDPVSPSLAALLAVTDIPRPTRRRTQRRRAPASVESEDGLGGPLEVLLSPPDDSGNSCTLPSLARTTSNDSIPSLGGDSSDTLSSLDGPSPALDEDEDELSPARRRRRRSSPVRRWLPSDAADAHPLVVVDPDDADDERPADYDDDESPKPLKPQLPTRPLRSVFRSNLTASLRAIRLAARSFSSAASSASSDEALLVTRSMLAIDANVPYTDERRPPLLEEMPSAELRRYLNPPPTTTTSTSSLLDGQPAVSRRSLYSASIQMQTYKVYRKPCLQRQSSSANSHNQAHHQYHDANNPHRRPREMRENPDFIRIAVMEMAMRRCGKLDGQRAGRARWALPPRKPATRPYEVGANGVPLRWTGLSVDYVE
ncbi:hypothetical protein CP533_6250 [Ophiocordyceps camponoti-saundersi (nom. inval.)]|nr:hypothetical protein CP533_6250 [Ophiocordyceps camponoti-saundersi (nom. inval.)]